MPQTADLDAPRLRLPRRRRVWFPHPLARGLVAAWLFTEGGGTRAYDIAFDRHTGDLTNGPLWARSPWGPTIDFDGVDDVVNVPHHADLDIMGDMTIVALLKPDVTATKVYSEKGNDSVNANITYGFGSDAGILAWTHAGSFVASSGVSITTVYQHLVMVRTVSNTTITYYIDGRKRAAVSYGATAPVSNTQSLGIGARGNLVGGLTYDGRWDYYLLYNRALTAGEAWQLYTAFPQLIPERFVVLGEAAGPVTVTPTPATMKLTIVNPAIIQSSLVFAPPRATFRFPGTIPTVIRAESFKKKQTADDPVWVGQPPPPPIVLDVKLLSGPSAMRLAAVAPTVAITEPCFLLQGSPIVRSLATVHGAYVDGDRIVWIVGRSGIGIELWRSNDRGVTWTFHQIPTWTSGQNIGTLSEPHLGNYWLFNNTTNELANTPQSNPGAGGFTINPFASTPSHIVIGSAGFMYLIRAGGADGVHRRDGASEPPPSPLMGNLFDGSHIFGRKIPGGDILVSNVPTLNKSIRRVTPSPFAIVNTFLHGLAVQETAEIGHPLAALSSVDYWYGLAADPGVGLRTINGGTSWSTTNVQTGFFPTMPNPRSVYLTGFARFGGVDYAPAMYYNAADLPNHRKRAKLAKFDGTEWVPAAPLCADVADAGVVAATAAGLNAAGKLDLYVITHDTPANTSRVYRTEIIN